MQASQNVTTPVVSIVLIPSAYGISEVQTAVRRIEQDMAAASLMQTAKPCLNYFVTRGVGLDVVSKVRKYFPNRRVVFVTLPEGCTPEEIQQFLTQRNEAAS